MHGIEFLNPKGLWLLTAIYSGKPFQLCINGCTREGQSRRPYSAAKIVALISVIVLALYLPLFQLTAVIGSS